MDQDDIIAEVELGSPHTAIDWCNFCREVVYDEFFIKKKNGGVGSIVEIDESMFGRRKYLRGYAVEGQWVFGGVERGTDRCFLVPVEKRDKETLLAVIKEWILPDKKIVSDFWKAYDCLNDEGYVHYKVNHSLHFKDPDSGQHSNTIKGLWRHAKHLMPQYHKSNLMFNGYLAKFMYLRYCKRNNLDVFQQFLYFSGKLYNPLNPQSIQHEDSEFEIQINI